jgi:hypothetical protein
VRTMWKTPKIGLFAVLLVFALFFVWSYVMVKLKIGMTIYADFEPLPFKLTGLLFYGRLFIQPMILAYIAYSYSSSKWKNLIFVLLLALGAWAALTSGSRFVGIMFAIPLFLLLKGKSRYIFFGIAVMAYITIATLSRSFYLPFQIGVDFIIQIYANVEHQTSALENLYLLPISYLISRPMGIGEVLMTMNFGDITPGIFDSLQNLFAYFLPFIPQGMGVSVKNIYGLDDDAFGGFGLDLFSNYWVFFGGSLIPYVFGLAFSAWLLGRTYRLFVIGLHRFEFKEGAMLVFILLFILFFEGRAFLFPWLLIAAWIFSRKNTPRRIFSIMRLFSLKHVFSRRAHLEESAKMQRANLDRKLLR